MRNNEANIQRGNSRRRRRDCGHDIRSGITDMLAVERDKGRITKGTQMEGTKGTQMVESQKGG
jgi:hypothetical protein